MGSLLEHDMTMDEIMRRWPHTIRIVIRNGMLCVGCPIAPFHTVSDAAVSTSWMKRRCTSARSRDVFEGGAADAYFPSVRPSASISRR